MADDVALRDQIRELYKVQKKRAKTIAEVLQVSELVVREHMRALGANLKRSEEEKLRHQARASELYLQGWKQREIAEELNVSATTVSSDLAELRQRWIDNADISFDERMATELARIDRLEKEAWAAWEDSKAAVETFTQAGGEGIPARVSKTRVTRTGDKRYLDVVSWCIEQRCKLLGLVVDRQVQIGYMQVEWVDPLEDDDDIGIGADELPDTVTPD